MYNNTALKICMANFVTNFHGLGNVLVCKISEPSVLLPPQVFTGGKKTAVKS